MAKVNLKGKKVLAVVGSRDFKDLKSVERWVTQNASHFDVLVTGDARGVDTTALNAWCAVKGMECHIVYKADWDRYGGYAGMKRNVTIVRDATLIVCFWDSFSHGSLDDIGLVLGSGKPMNLYVR